MLPHLPIHTRYDRDSLVDLAEAAEDVSSLLAPYDPDMRTLEFRARIDDPKPVMTQVRSLGADLWGDLRQIDTCFEVAHGCLKLRETAGFPGELIAYTRDEQATPRLCDHDIAPMPDAARTLAVLTAALERKAVVRKKRTLLLLDTARVHLDNVEHLGQFLELEVPVRGEDDTKAAETLGLLMQQLGLTWDQCIRTSYADLLLANTSA